MLMGHCCRGQWAIWASHLQRAWPPMPKASRASRGPFLPGRGGGFVWPRRSHGPSGTLDSIRGARSCPLEASLSHSPGHVCTSVFKCWTSGCECACAQHTRVTLLSDKLWLLGISSLFSSFTEVSFTHDIIHPHRIYSLTAFTIFRVVRPSPLIPEHSHHPKKEPPPH